MRSRRKTRSRRESSDPADDIVDAVKRDVEAAGSDLGEKAEKVEEFFDESKKN
jgi:hypothetical protein